MAVTPLGAAAPAPGASRWFTSAPLASGPTRTRRPHGVFALGAGLVASVHSSKRRQPADPRNIKLTLTTGTTRINAGMTPAQARELAAALMAAALVAPTAQPAAGAADGNTTLEG